MVPLDALQLFSPAELELLISGLPDVDVADLRRNTVYGSGLGAADRLVQWFWAAVEGMSKQDAALLVQFVTGARPHTRSACASACRLVSQFSRICCKRWSLPNCTVQAPQSAALW
jgi:HECT-domain (ubiquitin-transferase)